MSIATLKKKTAAKYNNVSVNVPQFSTVGGYRSQGWVGQTSLSRSLPRTLRRGDTLRGNGGCCGTYPIVSIVNPDLCCKNDNKVIKKASMNTNGMLMSRYRWIRRPAPYTSVKPGAGNILYRSEGDLTERKRKAVTCCTPAGPVAQSVPCNSCNTVPTMFRNYQNTPQSFSEPYPNTVTKTEEEIGVAISQGDRIEKEASCCVKNDVVFLDQDNQTTYCRTNFTCGS